MLTDIQIKENKERFLNLIKSIKREDADIEGLVNKLNNSDFFTAPASTQYHASYTGGLCQHSLNVYDQLCKLIEMEYPRFGVDENGERYEIDNYVNPYTSDTVKIVALLHDFSKMNFYETAERNTKDEKGNWIKVPFIKVKEAKDRFLYSTHGANSEYMVGRFIPLTLEESIAIINHMGGKEEGAPQFDKLSEIFNRFPLLTLLHTSDMLATYIDERMDK